MNKGHSRLERQERRIERRTTVGRGTNRNRKKSKHELKKDLKSQRRAEWAARAGTAANRKVKRVRSSGIAGGSHPTGPCRNHGCLRCSSVAARAAVNLRTRTHGAAAGSRLSARVAW